MTGFWDAMASAGPYANKLHLAPKQIPHQHLIITQILQANQHCHTHTHLFNGPFSGTTRVSRYQKGKTNLDFTEVRDSEWQWHQLGHMQVCILLQTDNHASAIQLTFSTGRMPFLPPNQQRQSTEGKNTVKALKYKHSLNKIKALKLTFLKADNVKQ